MHIDEKTLLAKLDNLTAAVNDNKFADKFVIEEPPEKELDGDPSMQDVVDNAMATRFLIDRNAGRMEIELFEQGQYYGSVYQDLNDSEIYTSAEGGEPLSDTIREHLIDKGVAINDVDDPEAYNGYAHLEVVGFAE